MCTSTWCGNCQLSVHRSLQHKHWTITPIVQVRFFMHPADDGIPALLKQCSSPGAFTVTCLQRTARAGRCAGQLRGVSTFMAEMLETAAILKVCAFWERDES